jgi:hypothetical protein
MTILRSGSTRKYAAGWQLAFGNSGPKKKKAVAAKKKTTAAKKKASGKKSK